MAARANVSSVHVFESALGWVALVGSGKVLRQLSFGHASPQAALAALDGALADTALIDTARIEDWNRALARRLCRFAAGERVEFDDVELDLADETPFTRRVIAACRAIPYGERRSYGEIAAAAGSPRAARAVGNVMRTNRTPLVVPCHRVVGSGTGLGGYSGAAGVRTKLRLLEAEAQASQAGKAQKRTASGLRTRRRTAAVSA